jgi:hypothetical protein
VLGLVEILEFDVPKVRSEEVDAAMESAVGKLIYTPADVPSDAVACDLKGKPQKDHLDALRSFAENPFIGLEERREELGVHPELLSRLIEDLQSMGFLGDLESFGVGKAKPRKSAFVSEKGSQILGMPFSQCVPAGRGGVCHRFLQDLLSHHLGSAVKEWQRGDVVRYEDDRSTTCYEIELNPSNDHFLRNIEVDLPLFDLVVVVAKNPRDRSALKKKAEEKLPAEILERVSFMTVKEVLDND